jgi:hypothetical protein
MPEPKGRSILDAPLSRSMTAEGDVSPRSRGTNASELSERTALENEEGAGKAGCRPHPWSACNKKARGRTTGTGGSSGLPCAMALRLIRALSGDHAFLPPSSARRVKRLRQLSACIGAPRPHDFTVRTNAARRAKKRPAICVHRIPQPTFVTIAKRPSQGCRMAGKVLLICPTGQAQSRAASWRDGQISHGIHARMIGSGKSL